MSQPGESRIEYEEGYAPRREKRTEIAGLVKAKDLVKPREEEYEFREIPREGRGEREKWEGMLSRLPVGMCVEVPKGVKAMRSSVGRYRRRAGGSFEVRAHGEGSRVWRVK